MTRQPLQQDLYDATFQVFTDLGMPEDMAREAALAIATDSINGTLDNPTERTAEQQKIVTAAWDWYAEKNTKGQEDLTQEGCGEMFRHKEDTKAQEIQEEYLAGFGGALPEEKDLSDVYQYRVDYWGCAPSFGDSKFFKSILEVENFLSEFEGFEEDAKHHGFVVFETKSGDRLHNESDFYIKQGDEETKEINNVGELYSTIESKFIAVDNANDLEPEQIFELDEELASQGFTFNPGFYNEFHNNAQADLTGLNVDPVVDEFIPDSTNLL